MTPKLKIIPLGGLGEIGKNMTVIEFGNDLIIIDCGMGFPDENMYGIDVVLPDITYLRNNASRIRGMIITHGHEDHIGAVPFVLKELDIPIYTTPLTAALIELKLEEEDLLYNTQIFTKKAGSVFRIGSFSIEFIRVNHSIPDAVALAIRTPVGTVIHTGDFKIDVTPIAGGMTDLVRFGELGNEGVLALLSDSTNVETPGHSASERKVGESFDKLFVNCDKRIIITTFASNVHRLQQIINVAAKYGRKVAVTGRSMENVLRTLRPVTKGRLITLFGCGGDRDRQKRPIMGKVAAEFSDFVIVTSDNPRTEDPDAIIAEIVEGLKDSPTPYHVLTDRIDAIHYAIDNAGPGDVILLAGKGHEDYQIVGHEKHHMDEREIVADYLKEKGSL